MAKSAKHNPRLKREYAQRDKDRYFQKRTRKDYPPKTTERRPNPNHYNEELANGETYS